MLMGSLPSAHVPFGTGGTQQLPPAGFPFRGQQRRGKSCDAVIYSHPRVEEPLAPDKVYLENQRHVLSLPAPHGFQALGWKRGRHFVGHLFPAAAQRKSRILEGFPALPSRQHTVTGFFPSSNEEKGEDPGYAQGVYPDTPAPGRHKPFSPRRCRPLEAEGRRDGGRPAALLQGRGVSVAPGDRRRGFPAPAPTHPPRASPFPEPVGFQTFRVRRRRDWRGGGHLHANEAPPPAARRSIGTRGKEHAFRLGRRGESRPQHAPSAPRNSPHRRLPAGCRGTPLPRTPSLSKATASLLCFLMNPG